MSDPPLNSERFDEWLTHTAESKGIPKKELINQLVSSYWVLDELNDLDGGSDLLHTTSSIAEPETERGPDTRSPPTEQGGERTEPVTSSEAERNDSESTQTDVSDIKEEIETLRTSIHGSSLLSTLNELQRQVDDVSLELEDQRAAQNEFIDRVSDDVTRLNGRIAEVEAETDQLARKAELEEATSNLESKVEALDEFDTELETWIGNEFDNIEQLFEHLLESSDKVRSRVRSLESDVSELKEAQEHQRQLAELRREAMESGVDAGTCDSCSRKVDISMLDAPECPGCNRYLTGVSDSGWNPFSAPTLVTTQRE